MLNISLCTANQPIHESDLNTSEVVLIIDNQQCTIQQKILNAEKLGYGGLIILMNYYYQKVEAGKATLEIYNEIPPQPKNISLIPVAIGTDDIPILLSLLENNDCTISFEKMDMNPYIYHVRGITLMVFRIIICIFLSIFIAYGIYVLLCILKYKASKEIQLIIIFGGEASLISILLFYALDPFHCTGILGKTTYSLLSMHPFPLNVIITILLSIIWQQMMTKDLQMNHSRYLKNTILIFLSVSAVLYPLIMISVYVYTREYRGIFFALFMSILFTIVLLGSIIFYMINLVRVIIHIANMKGIITSTVKHRHLDKLLVAFNYLILVVDIIIVSLYETVAVILVFYNLFFLCMAINCALFFYFVRITKSDVIVTNKSSIK